MNHAIRSTVGTNYPAPILFTTSLSLPSKFGRKTSALRFRQVTAVSGHPEREDNMEKQAQNPNQKTGDMMSHSFGEGYATRSDEEGFGGIYGGNQSLPKKPEDDKHVHENHPDYDKTQGSEVKEKEKARHQTDVSD